MRTFQEFVDDQQPGMQQPGVFGNVGMDKGQVNPTMTALNRLMGRGATEKEDKQAVKYAMRVLKTPINRLRQEGLTANDLILALQAVINLVSGTTNPMLNRGMVRRKIQSDV